MISRTTRSAKAALNPLLSWRPGVHDLAEIMLLAVALPIYYLVRGVTVTQVDEAISRGADIVSMEKSLGIFWEVELQSWILSYQWLVKLLNWFYLFGHLPVIGTLAVWLYFWHRPEYLLMRNAVLISGAIGLVVYATFPVAPPRFLPAFGFTDTVFSQYGVSRVANPAFLRNEYAAVPSLHFGWNVLAAVALWLASRNLAVRSLAMLVPLATMAAVVLTANHFILDAVFGLLAIAVGMAAALAFRALVVRYRSRGPLASGGSGWVSWLGGVAPAGR